MIDKQEASCERLILGKLIKMGVPCCLVRSGSMQQNVIEFGFPNAMDEIPEDRFDEAFIYPRPEVQKRYCIRSLWQAHLIALHGLRIPREGFFTICMLVQYFDLPDVCLALRSCPSELASHSICRCDSSVIDVFDRDDLREI